MRCRENTRVSETAGVFDLPYCRTAELRGMSWGRTARFEFGRQP